MRILHIGFDSHFVDYLVARFEQQQPGANELIVVSHTEPAERERAFAGPRTWLQPRAEHVVEVQEKAAAVDVVVVHAMTEFAALVCAELPSGVLLVWSGFGYDYYVGESGVDLVGERTLALVQRTSGGRQPDRNGKLVLEWERARLEPLAVDFVRQRAAARADYFSAPIDADLHVFARAFPGFAGEYRQLNYGDLASMAPTRDAVVTGDDILVGNSASWANNHLEAFRLLAKADLGDRRVVVPLTYGDDAYRDAVLAAGRRKLGERFHPLVDHLPIQEYLTLLGSCGVVLFNHRRQQGVGNIVAALQQGAHVYLDRRNPLFGWLRDRDVVVQPPRALLDQVPVGPVPDEQLDHNRRVLAETWSEDRVEANLRSLLEELEARLSASARRVRRPRAFAARRAR
ncbi:TDP-N-acetylfucosamine:lipid II N-acetylfucosaminyltransferase [Pimelobacter sp. 30-1]|uniref:TDP-N-acetylfucosamine:lipid II N-acetylfucosaminyltransferase n=1 Tax=Pimelobacter sp. 30-1 TaxID=2004991 RepID=UPI001C05D717|nr:TDP-N-acetylfucosamine:lipid II N-acetylfucosaminyltransferase [Pimelobacter sp. 30-1]MBU2695119.1 hypothetical protein [Pimelobacter sp. 30-1]